METLFGDYPLDRAFDEMREPSGEVRPHYRALAETLARLPQDELQRRKQSAELSFLTQGITFTVYGRDEGTERIFPYDLLPRLVTAQEWDRIERGLTQRITALNLFLRDVYSDAKILNDRVVPRELVYSCKHYRRQMRGLQVPRNVYIAVVGTDLLRLNTGEFVVLEDNLRVPSGVSYMLTNRRVMKRTFPAALPQLRRAAHRALSATAAGHAALAGAGGPPGAEHRAAHARRLQLGLLRAHLPGPPDGHRSGRRPRPGDPRQHRLHAHHRRAEARGRDLPPRGRRLQRSADLPRAIRRWAAPGCSMPIAPAT